MVQELTELGLSEEAMDGIVDATKIDSLEALQQLLGADNEAVEELQTLFGLAEGYGIAQYLQLDTSCVRGLAYYTGRCRHFYTAVLYALMLLMTSGCSELLAMRKRPTRLDNGHKYIQGLRASGSFWHLMIALPCGQYTHKGQCYMLLCQPQVLCLRAGTEQGS